MSTLEKTQTLLETIDLTGRSPVVGTKVVEKTIQIHNIDVEDVNMKSPTVLEQKTISTVIDRRLRKCEICLEELCKYTCPGCKMKTCCLSCGQKHKRMTGCTGRREKTVFVAKSKFDNFHLLNDYRFLEEANRLADNAKRDYKNVPGKPQKKEQILSKNVSRSGVHLYRMAKGMKRWKENKSYYNIKDQTLFWTMKFVFDGIKEPILTKQPETMTFKDLLSKYIGEDNCSEINKEQFCKHIHYFRNDKLRIFFKQEIDPGTNNLRYAELDIADTIKDGLKNKSVLEYPVFHIVCPENADTYREEPYLQVPASDSEEELWPEDDHDDDDITQPVAKQRKLDGK